MNELHLFAGAGGGILGGMLLGHRPVCAVEIEPYCREVLLQRQRDGILPWFPIWDDVRTFDGKPWRGIVDVICGGFPCQDISVAGKGAGLEGERSGLWSEMRRIIGEVRPKRIVVENSPMLAIRGGSRVIADLASMGYVGRWGTMGAIDAGLPHYRYRWWIIADSDCNGLQGRQESRGCRSGGTWPQKRLERLLQADTWVEEASAGVFGTPDGVARGMDRIKAIGNGQVPRVAAAAFTLLAA